MSKSLGVLSCLVTKNLTTNSGHQSLGPKSHLSSVSSRLGGETQAKKEALAIMACPRFHIFPLPQRFVAWNHNYYGGFMHLDGNCCVNGLSTHALVMVCPPLLFKMAQKRWTTHEPIGRRPIDVTSCVPLGPKLTSGRHRIPIKQWFWGAHADIQLTKANRKNKTNNTTKHGQQDNWSNQPKAPPAKTNPRSFNKQVLQNEGYKGKRIQNQTKKDVLTENIRTNSYETNNKKNNRKKTTITNHQQQ